MTNQRRRVVISGLGVVSPLAHTLADTWDAVVSGRSGIAPITKFDASGFKTKIAGEVKGFDSLAFVSAKELRRMDAFIVYALAAAEMALRDAGLFTGAPLGDRAGIIIGTGIGGITTIEKEKETLLEMGPRKISPFTIPAALANLAPGQIAIRFGAKGPINCTVTACSSSNNAIHDAFRTIAYGDADIMITGGTEAAVCPMTVAGFNAMRAISTRNDAPEKASRPFDADRDGFIIGEGCGIIILEELEAARKRGAPIYAEIAGSAVTSDAYHVSAPPPGHEGAVRCMTLALKDAGMMSTDIDYINAHGTSTVLNDAYESQAIETVFGEHARRLAVSSTKSMTGHLLGAAGGVEAAITALAMHHGIVPPTINLDNPDPECTLDYVPHKARSHAIHGALSNAFGFGGVNAVIAFRKWGESGKS